MSNILQNMEIIDKGCQGCVITCSAINDSWLKRETFNF